MGHPPSLPRYQHPHPVLLLFFFFFFSSIIWPCPLLLAHVFVAGMPKISVGAHMGHPRPSKHHGKHLPGGDDPTPWTTVGHAEFDAALMEHQDEEAWATVVPPSDLEARRRARCVLP